MSESVIFLDIDGVLNHIAIFRERRRPKLCPEAMKRLDRLVAQTSCKVVLSSTWRKLDQHASYPEGR